MTSLSDELDLEITKDGFKIKSVNNDKMEVFFENKFHKTIVDCSWFIHSNVLVILFYISYNILKCFNIFILIILIFFSFILLGVDNRKM